MRAARSSPPLALAMILVAACGTSTKASAGPAPIAQADFPATFAAALCGGIEACCAQTKFAYDRAACTAAEESSFRAALDANLAHATFDANAAGRCLDALKRVLAACADDPAQDDSVTAACAPMLVGAKQPGEACADAACAPSSSGWTECASWTTATLGPNGPSTVTQSRCIVHEPARAGGPCGNALAADGPSTISDCTDDPSLYCDGKVCQRRVAAGQACQGISSDECVRGASCEGATCAALGGAGSPCGLFGKCAPGFVCDGATEACAAQAKPGEACSSASRCAAGVCSQGTCTAGHFATADACAGRASSAALADAGAGDAAAD